VHRSFGRYRRAESSSTIYGRVRQSHSDKRRGSKRTNMFPSRSVSKKVLMHESADPRRTKSRDIVLHSGELFFKEFRNEVLPPNPIKAWFSRLAGNPAQYATSDPRWGTPKNSTPYILASKSPYTSESFQAVFIAYANCYQQWKHQY